MIFEDDLAETCEPVSAVCGARLHKGGTCTDPLVPGRKRCAKHGGATGAGGPPANRNGRYIDGFHGREAQEQRRWVRRQLSVAERADGRALAPPPAPDHLGARVQTAQANHRVALPPEGVEGQDWMAQLQSVLGGGSEPFVRTLLNQLIDAAATNRDHVATDESLSAALEIVRGLAPTSPAEAALAIHVAQLHMAAAAMNGRIALYGSTRATNEHAVAAAKLERAFLAAFDTYHRVRFGNRQVIRIERVVEVERDQ